MQNQAAFLRGEIGIQVKADLGGDTEKGLVGSKKNAFRTEDVQAFAQVMMAGSAEAEFDVDIGGIGNDARPIGIEAMGVDESEVGVGTGQVALRGGIAPTGGEEKDRLAPQGDGFD